jgi:hypothetical protein
MPIIEKEVRENAVSNLINLAGRGEAWKRKR